MSKELDMKIVVIGGTGLIGSKLVSTLRAKGHEVLAASPDSGVNTITGEGLPAAPACDITSRCPSSAANDCRIAAICAPR
jgi:nucleoside-diphosphate-sugar epimerase